MCGCERHYDGTSACTCVCPEHANFRAAWTLAMARFDQIQVLQQEVARLSGELEAAKQAAREIMAERNTWARELADMRDERDTARDEFDKVRTLWAESDNNSIARQVALEGAIQQVLEIGYKNLFQEDLNKALRNLRRVLDDD